MCKIVCSCCGVQLDEESAYVFEDRFYCDECLSERTVICDCCGTRIWRSNAEMDTETTLCSTCFEYEYTVCEDCGRLIPNDDAYCDDESDCYYCHECYNKRFQRPIKCYSYKPTPIFYGDDNLYLGVELEIDKGGEDQENAQEIVNIVNASKEQIYCKHDGSIQDGFEIVTHPMSLNYHKSEMNWRELFIKAINLGYCSHNTTTCGLHVHVNRSAFGTNNEAQEQAISRIVYFVEHHWNELVKFSRRTQDNLNRWASRYESISPTAKETYRKAKEKDMGRYVAVNLTNYETVEFRMFRGTLKYSTFIATLELVAEICKLAKNLTDNEVERLSWADFVLSISNDENPELIEYLKSKRLYVNELQEESEDI